MRRRRSSCSRAFAPTSSSPTCGCPAWAASSCCSAFASSIRRSRSIIMTAYGSIEGAVEAVKLGAFDYLKKPVDLEELKLLADRARETSLLKQELSYYRGREARKLPFAGMIGESPAIRAIMEQARQIAALDDTPPVLITGETGTGKGLIAHTIHASGPRASKPFIEVNCTALPGEPHGGRAVRPRARRVHRCEAVEDRTVRGGGARLHLPRRDRRHGARRCRASCCARSRSGWCGASAAFATARSMCASSPRRIAISSARRRRARSGAISTFVSP